MRQSFKTITAQPTVTQSSAYASGNCIGSTLTFSNLAQGGNTAVISASIVDASGANAACDLFLFSKAPTAQTDKAAVSVSTADAANCIGVISFASGSYKSAGTPGIQSIPQMYMGTGQSADNNVYGQLVSRGTPNFGTNATPITIVLTADYRQE